MSKIEIKNLSFSYIENEPILENMNLVIDERSTAIVGQNGAGKTTFVKLLKGLLKPDEGEILLNDVSIKSMTVAKLAKHIGLVFQNPNDQIFKNKVIDEVMFGPLNIGMTKEGAIRNSKKALEMVGLSSKIDNNPYDLGLSERKLITIASVLAMNTDVVIFDEPTIAQDFSGKELIKSIIRQLKDEGKIVLTIIHDMDFVAETFERTVVFAKGNVLLDCDTRDVFSKGEILKKAYLEEPNVTKLCRALGYDETFLTANEFVEFRKNGHK
ncbi:energy-coupling factor ABC transporter ATP-binding protein [Clostridium saccharobutylicum]|uniref:Energy-coupling factor transporter ATP-binding protein EcfA2 n=1 Tax=Clostridium saccharobutylicum TaxID=169679 RepID=A0A1S8N1N7_CLOSA|nr:ABC transporter ATP-binding protein [Clostridium saccharobutylicum]OOM10429.1 energy-coupling factor transporter ATP-binding protein EcfA2 [Clostridium saccharobutylicum]